MLSGCNDSTTAFFGGVRSVLLNEAAGTDLSIAGELESLKSCIALGCGSSLGLMEDRLLKQSVLGNLRKAGICQAEAVGCRPELSASTAAACVSVACLEDDVSRIFIVQDPVGTLQPYVRQAKTLLTTYLDNVEGLASSCLGGSNATCNSVLADVTKAAALPGNCLNGTNSACATVLQGVATLRNAVLACMASDGTCQKTIASLENLTLTTVAFTVSLSEKCLNGTNSTCATVQQTVANVLATAENFAGQCLAKQGLCGTALDTVSKEVNAAIAAAGSVVATVQGVASNPCGAADCASLLALIASAEGRGYAVLAGIQIPTIGVPTLTVPPVDVPAVGVPAVGAPDVLPSNTVPSPTKLASGCFFKCHLGATTADNICYRGDGAEATLASNIQISDTLDFTTYFSTAFTSIKVDGYDAAVWNGDHPDTAYDIKTDQNRELMNYVGPDYPKVAIATKEENYGDDEEHDSFFASEDYNFDFPVRAGFLGYTHMNHGDFKVLGVGQFGFGCRADLAFGSFLN